MLIYPLAFLVTLGVLVTIHELGHFIVARWSGVRIVRFSVGFGKPLWSRFDRRGTEFALAAIPLGGYVRMLDERDSDEGVEIGPDDITYNQLGVWWRLAIALAGPLANFVLAAFVYWCLAVAGTTNFVPMVGQVDPASPIARAGLGDYRELVGIDGRPVRNWPEVVLALSDRMGDSGVIRIASRPFGAEGATTVEVPIRDWQRGVMDPDLLGSLGIVPDDPALSGQLAPDGPAARAGVRAWDRITTIDGRPIDSWRALVEEIRASPGKPMAWTLVRNGVLLTLTVTPDRRLAEDGSEIGFVGMHWATNEVHYGPLEAISMSIAETGAKTAMIFGHLRKMVVGEVSVRNMAGVVTIAKVAGDSVQVGWQAYAGLLALLSLSLGILNLLPIPLLDGGHVLYCLVELIGRRPVPERIQLLGAQIGLLLVGSLIVLTIINDISRFL